jgi:hypothetical protein
VNLARVEYIALADCAISSIIGSKSTRLEGEIYLIIGFAADSPLYDGYSL